MRELESQIKKVLLEDTSYLNSWQESLKNTFDTVPITEKELRHGFDRVFISSLASQLYCEIKLDFDIKYRPESTPEQVIGTEIHNALIPVEPVTPEQLVSTIESGQEYVSIFPVFLHHTKVLITGIPDGVIFRQKKPRYLFEIKTTNGKIDKVWPGEKFQAQLYSLALEYMGFDISELEIVIPKVSQKMDKQSLISEMVHKLDTTNKKTKIFLQDQYPIMLHVFPYNLRVKKNTLKTLDQLITFWNENRKASPSYNLMKCRPCPYKNECEYYNSKTNWKRPSSES